MKSYVELLENAIEQYIGLPVLNRLRTDPDNALTVDQKLIDATLLFMDVRSFTQFTKTIPTAKLVNELNRYFEKMSEIIIRHHGFIDSFIGDAIFAIFGISDDLHADNACHSAIECLNALEAFNKRPESLIPFDVGIGINSGKVTLGNIGSGYKLKFTAIGNMVNLASRLEGLTAQYKCRIIISDHTKKLLTMRFKTKKITSVAVKGLEGQFTVYSLEL